MAVESFGNKETEEKVMNEIINSGTMNTCLIHTISDNSPSKNRTAQDTLFQALDLP